jgi:hypothetical protein
MSRTVKYPSLRLATRGVLARDLEAHDRAYRRGLNEARARLREVVRDWQTDVDFAALPSQRREAYLYEIKAIGAGAQIFVYVDQGTEPHEIRPTKPGGVLAFRTGYSAKTAPVAQHAVGTGKATGAHVVATVVHHPGTEARQFTAVIFQQMRDKITVYINEERSNI